MSHAERRGLLSGQAPVGQVDKGRIVCACFQVGINTIQDDIRKHGLDSVEAITQRLKAGGNCGSCIPELRTILASTMNSTHA